MITIIEEKNSYVIDRKRSILTTKNIRLIICFLIKLKTFTYLFFISLILKFFFFFSKLLTKTYELFVSGVDRG